MITSHPRDSQTSCVTTSQTLVSPQTMCCHVHETDFEGTPLTTASCRRRLQWTQLSRNEHDTSLWRQRPHSAPLQRDLSVGEPRAALCPKIVSNMFNMEDKYVTGLSPIQQRVSVYSAIKFQPLTTDIVKSAKYLALLSTYLSSW